MKYLKKYKIFESKEYLDILAGLKNKVELFADCFRELEDRGFTVVIEENTPYAVGKIGGDPQIGVSISKNKDFDINDIVDDIKFAISYSKDELDLDLSTADYDNYKSEDGLPPFGLRWSMGFVTRLKFFNNINSLIAHKHLGLCETDFSKYDPKIKINRLELIINFRYEIN